MSLRSSLASAASGIDARRRSPGPTRSPSSRRPRSIAFGLLLSVDVGHRRRRAGARAGWRCRGAGCRPALLRRCGVVLSLGAVPAGVAAVLFGVDSGAILLAARPGHGHRGVADRRASRSRCGSSPSACPASSCCPRTDPTDLADALAQVLRLPARFMLAALAATRLFGVMAAEWRSMSLARRARGLGDDGPLGAAAHRVRAGLRAAGAGHPPGHRAGHRHGGARLRHRSAAHLGPREPVARARRLLVLGGAALAAAAIAAGVAAGPGTCCSAERGPSNGSLGSAGPALDPSAQGHVRSRLVIGM